MKKVDFADLKSKSKFIDISDVRFNSWNPKQKKSADFEKVLESLRLNGQVMPIVVRTNPDEDTTYEVLDGEQRLTAMIELGEEKIWVLDEGKVSDEEAKAKTLWYEQHVGFEQEALAELLLELKDQIELPFSDLDIQLITDVEVPEEEEELPKKEKKKSFNEKFTVFLTPDHFEFISEMLSEVMNRWQVNQDIALQLIFESTDVNLITEERVRELLKEVKEQEDLFYQNYNKGEKDE